MSRVVSFRARPQARPEEAERARLRAWLEFVAQTAVDWLDELDALEAELEDDEREITTEDDDARPVERRRA